jgi:hypothetical protein
MVRRDWEAKGVITVAVMPAAAAGVRGVAEAVGRGRGRLLAGVASPGPARPAKAPASPHTPEHRASTKSLPPVVSCSREPSGLLSRVVIIFLSLEKGYCLSTLGSRALRTAA